MFPRAARIFVGVEVVLGVAYFLLEPSVLRAAGYCAASLGMVVAVVLGTRLWWPSRPMAWYLIAGGQLLFSIGDAFSYYHEWVLGVEVPFPSVADGVYLAFYPMLAAGLLLLVRGRAPGGDAASLIDATIITTGVGMLSWVFLIGPYVRLPDLCLSQRPVSIAYRWGPAAGGGGGGAAVADRRRTRMALVRCDSVSGVALSDRLADPPAADGVPSRPSGRWRTLLRLAVAAVFLAVIAVVMAGQWQQAKPLLGRLSVASVLGALALIWAGLYATFRCWWAALADLGGELPTRPAMRVFYLGQLGKYLPGTVWPAVTQMRLGRDYQVPPRASGAAFVVFMLVIVGTGLLVGVPVIPLLGKDAADQYHWLLLVLPLLAVAVAPPVLNRALALALRLARRPPLPAPLSLGGILKVAGWAIASWLCYGVHVYLLARQLGAEGGALLWLQSTGAFAAAFASGPLLVIAPAGAGVREAALLLLLGSTITAPRAAVIAVISRLLFIVGDLAWAAIALVAERRLVVRLPWPRRP